MTTMTQGTPNPKRGDVVLVLYPNSDLRTAKRRPALVIQANNLNTGLDQVIVAMISSRLFRANHPCRILIRVDSAEGSSSGLLGDSVTMTDNLAAVFLPAIDRNIGTIPMSTIDRALRLTLGL